MLVSAPAAPGAPPPGLQPRSARSLRRSGPLGPAKLFPLKEAPTVRVRGGGCGLGASSWKEMGLGEPAKWAWSWDCGFGKNGPKGCRGARSGGTAGVASGAGTELLGEARGEGWAGLGRDGESSPQVAFWATAEAESRT